MQFICIWLFQLILHTVNLLALFTLVQVLLHHHHHHHHGMLYAVALPHCVTCVLGFQVFTCGVSDVWDTLSP